jgi:hypothetical protein
MKLNSLSLRIPLLFFTALLCFSGLRASAQTTPDNAATSQLPVVPARITQAIDETQLVTLKGNVHPLARPEFDQGLVPDPTPMNRMLLLLQRSPEQQAALDQLMLQQMSKDSPNFHKWLTPQEFGARFGPADADIQTVTTWLASQGFHDIKVANGRLVIEFSGNVAQVRNAFHTEIHHFLVNTEMRQANVSDPQIPAALTPVVRGIVTLNNFPRKSTLHSRGTMTGRLANGRVVPEFTGNNNQFFIVGPADFAKIYDIPSAGFDGTGVTLAIIGFTNINTQDMADFQNLFGLPSNPPNIIADGPLPDVNGEEGEADLDLEVADSVAPKATIDFVTSEGTLTANGSDLSSFFVIDNNSADVMSLSFGACEANLTATGNSFYSGLWEQAAAQGITVTVSAGDNGSAGCDDFNTAQTASNGLAVSGIASTPFNVAVGGTDFDDVGTQATFWNAMNSADGKRESAIGYIPEIPWNDSCAATATTSSLTTCVNPGQGLLNIVAASGGASIVNAKPSYQNGLPPADGARDLPDVSLFASDGPASKSFYLVCQADAIQAGKPPSCSTAGGSFSFIGAGGTSASSPAFAGIMALIDQQMKGRQGNANFVLYKIAANSCNSSSRTVPTNPPVPATCVFNDVTKGNNSVPCAGNSPNCSSPTAGANGVLFTTISGTKTPAFTTTSGYDLATGLGSVNVANLATAWATAVAGFNPTLTNLTINGSKNPAPIMHGTGVTTVVTVTSGAAGTPTGDFSLVAPTKVNGGIGQDTLSGGTKTDTGVILPGGTNYFVTAHYAGDGTFAPSDSNAVPVTVNPENSRLQIGIVTPASTAASPFATTFAYGSSYVLRMDILNSSANACLPFVTGGATNGCAFDATGNVTITDNGNKLDAGTFPINSAGHAEDQPIQLLPGNHALIANYAGDISYNAAPPVNLALTVSKATTSTSVSSVPSTVASGGMVTLTASISTQSNGAAPGGTVQFLNGSTVIPGTVTITATAGSANASASLTATLTTTITALGLPDLPAPQGPITPLLPVLVWACLSFLLAYTAFRLARNKRRGFVYAGLLLMLAGIAAITNGCGSSGGGGPQFKSVTINAQYSGDGNYAASNGQTSVTVQ